MCGQCSILGKEFESKFGPPWWPRPWHTDYKKGPRWKFRLMDTILENLTVTPEGREEAEDLDLDTVFGHREGGCSSDDRSTYVTHAERTTSQGR